MYDKRSNLLKGRKDIIPKIVYTIDRTDVRINGIKSKIGGTEMNSNCDRLGRRKIGKNEKLWNERNHADADAEKRLCAAESAAVAVSRAPCEGCRRNRPCKGRPRWFV